MKILFIDKEFPYPLNFGKIIHTFNLTENLAQVNEVSYLAYGEEKSESYNYPKDNNILLIAVDAHCRLDILGKKYNNHLLKIVNNS